METTEQYPLHDVGLWLELRTSYRWDGKGALFLDRDGVVVEETHYICKAEDVRMIQGAAETIRWANEKNMPVVIVTNQAGIGRGYYDWSGFKEVQHVIHTALEQKGAHIDMVLACAYHKDGVLPYVHQDHHWRKPNPGMIEQAAEQLSIELHQSLLIGDKVSDLIAASRAKIGYGCLVKTGYGKQEAKLLDAAELAPMVAGVAEDIDGAIISAVERGWLAD